MNKFKGLTPTPLQWRGAIFLLILFYGSLFAQQKRPNIVLFILALFVGAKTSVYVPGINLPFIVKSPFMKNGNSETNGLSSFTNIMPTILDYAGIKSVNNLYKKEELQPLDWHEMPADIWGECTVWKKMLSDSMVNYGNKNQINHPKTSIRII
jgi:hypothetical protein